MVIFKRLNLDIALINNRLIDYTVRNLVIAVFLLSFLIIIT